VPELPSSRPSQGAIQYQWFYLNYEDLLTCPKQFLGPTENACDELRLSDVNRGSSSHRSGMYLSGSAKLLMEWDKHH
jgi:hypothetical protein